MKTISDLGDKVPEETKSECESAIAELKTALEGEDTDAITSATGPTWPSVTPAPKP